MRIAVFWIFVLIILLLLNIVLYNTNEEYRFFVTKIRYQEDIIESHGITLNDSVITQSERELLGRNSQDNEIEDEGMSVSAMEFLESISGSRTRTSIDTQNLELLPSEAALAIVDYLWSYNLESVNSEEYLFSVTPEYPDPFLQWYSSDVNFYTFPTKTYRDLFDIFDVLGFELPIYINEVNNFWEKSFFINMENGWEDWFVRIVFEYENEVFWLKIKNLHYNAIRDMLAERL